MSYSSKEMLKALIDRPVTVTMAILVVVVLGSVSLRLLPVSLIPDVDIPYITVQASDVKLSAREMDESVIRPLRDQLIQLDGLQDITCESRDGSGIIRLCFGHGTDMGYLLIEVNEKIDRAMGSLPDIARPRVFMASATDIPAFFMDITVRNGGEEDFIQLSRFCRDVISKRVEQLPEVAMADISGTLEEQILVLPREDKLAQLGLSLQQFDAAISSANIRLGTLTIRDGEYRYNVKFDAKAGSAEDIAAVWIRSGERLLQVGDVAEVSVTGAKRTGLVRSGGQKAVTLAVINQRDARMSTLKKEIDSLVKHFEEDYPQLHFEITRDQTALLEYSIHNLIGNIILGVLLACLVVFLFMKNTRSAALVCLTMPTSLFFSMLVFYLFGLSLNIISLSGLLLGVGMMADNSIILIDNITARWEREKVLRNAVLGGTREVMGPMLSAVLTTCAVFIPLMFVNGIAGALFHDEALAVTIVLFTSYVVTVVVIPVFYYWWYKGMRSFRGSVLLERLSLDTLLQKWDERRMTWWLDHRWVAWGLVGVSVIGFALCLAGMDRKRLPDMTETERILKVEWNDRISVEENERRTAALESVLSKDALQYTSLVGMQQFALGHSGEQGVAEMQLYYHYPDTKSLEGATCDLEKKLQENYSGAAWSFTPPGSVFDMVFADTQPPLLARLRPVGDPEVRLETLRPLIARIRKSLPGLSIQPVCTKTDILFVADPERMALYQVSYDDLAFILRSALNENHVFDIVQGSRILPVVSGTDRADLDSVLSEAFIEKDGNRIPASDLMRQSYSEDLRTIVSGAEGSYYPLALQVRNKDVPEVMERVRKVVHEDGAYQVSFDGTWFSNRRMVKDLLLVLLVAIALLYLILASQFESLLQPIIILLEIVIDFFATLLALWALGVSINLMSLIGLVVVSGIVINDSILKIDTVNRLRRNGMPLRDAVLTASSRRLKAILMTSLTTILAVAPFLSRGSMGADLQYPLSLVIIVGMIVGTLVSLFVVPTLYSSLYERNRGT